MASMVAARREELSSKASSRTLAAQALQSGLGTPTHVPALQERHDRTQAKGASPRARPRWDGTRGAQTEVGPATPHRYGRAERGSSESSRSPARGGGKAQRRPSSS